MSNIPAEMCERLRLKWQKLLGAKIEEDLQHDMISKVGWATRECEDAIHSKIAHRYCNTPWKLFKLCLI